MQNSLFLARLIGPVMLLVGVSVVLNAREFRALAQEAIASRAILFLSGLLIMPVGLAIVLTHNVWSGGWRILITLLGWLMTIGGAIRLFVPRFVEAGGRAMLRQQLMPPIAGAIWAAIGLVLCYFGYLH